MKNDIHFRNNKLSKTEHGNNLVLVNDTDPDNSRQDDIRQDNTSRDAVTSAEQQTQTALITLMSVSIACAAAALATGSYAAWLAHQKSAHQALTDVNEILKSCQKRMQQLEADVERLPSR
jgi:hypothetical protein